MSDIQYIIDLNKELDVRDGPPTDGSSLSNRFIAMGNETGKTTVLIWALPEDGHAVIFIDSRKTSDELIGHIPDLRGSFYPLNNIRFIYVNQFMNITKAIYEAKKTGVPKKRWFFDNTAHDYVISDLFNNIYYEE